MAYRKFDTGTWIDPWFENLSTKAKLGFIYLWTNEICNPAGIYEVSEKRIKFELGYGIDTISEELKEKVIWYPYHNLVWIKNFFRRQCQNYKFAIAALNSIKDDPIKLKLFIEYNQKLIESFRTKEGRQIVDVSGYHIDMVSIPYPTEQNRTEQKQNRTEQNRTEQNRTASTSSCPNSIEFRLANLLSEKICENNPKAKKPDLEKWSPHIEKLIRIDKQNPDDIESVIEWCQSDTFWMCNILSTEKLRDKFPQLFLKMKAESGSPQKINQPQDDPDKYKNIPVTEINIDE